MGVFAKVRVLGLMTVLLLGCSAKLLGCGSNGNPPGADLTRDRSQADLAAVDRGPAGREAGPDGPVKSDGPTPKPCGFKIGTGANPQSGENTGFTIGGTKRRFLVLKENVPAGSTAKLPVVFTFHGYGGSVTSVNTICQLAPQNKPFIKVVPQAINTGFPVWDFKTNPQDSVDLKFFDEMLSCLAAELPIDPDRIHAIGGSIGAIFVDYLLTHRGHKLASVATMSGGFLPFPKSASYYYDWPYDTLLASLTSKAAVMVYWGGPTDQGGGFDFHQGAQDAIQKLRANTHFVVKCMHDQGHDWNEQFTKFAFLFFEDHPRGVKPAPWASGLPKPPFPAPDASWPSYCSIAP